MTLKRPLCGKEYVQFATLEERTTLVQIVTDPRATLVDTKLTVPVTEGATVAVKVTGTPTEGDFDDVTNEVVVAALVTETDTDP